MKKRENKKSKEAELVFEDLNEEMAMRNDERDKDDEGDEHDVTFRE